MACWSDTETVVNYLRHSFITCDDTGVCEAVLEPPTLVAKPGGIKMPPHCSISGDEDEESETEISSFGQMAHSPDIHVDPGHRPRSNTAKQLEQLKQQRLAQNKVKHVPWKSSENPLSAEELDAIFVRKPIVPRKPILESAVSKMIREAPNFQENFFQEYAKFETMKAGSVPAKTFAIFLPMLDNVEKRSKPLTVTVLATAKVSELVGLVCYKYTMERFVPALRTDVSCYCLHMAEENGEIEADLPPLNTTETVGRVGFPALALVERLESTEKRPTYVATVYFPSGESYRTELASLDVTLESVKEKILKQRFLHKDVPAYSRKIFDYNMEKVTEPDVPLPLDMTVQNAGTTVFVMVRKNSSRGDFTIAGSQKHASTAKTKECGAFNLGSSVCHFYNVQMVYKFKANTPVQLAVCTDKVEVVASDRKRSNTTSKIFRPTSAQLKSYSFPVKHIGGVEVLEEKQNRKLFRLIHTTEASDEWRSHYFEAESHIVDQVVLNVNRILDQVRSEAREAFKQRIPRKTSLFKRMHSSNHGGSFDISQSHS